MSASKNNPGVTRRFSGFTLIELLVVIAIIAILAAILFPVFAKARKNAQQTTCTSNLNQIGKAVMLYCDDNDGHFPRAMDYTDYLAYTALSAATPPVPLLWGGNPAKDANWRQLDGPVGAYLKSRDVWHCPSDIGSGAYKNQLGTDVNVYSGKGTTAKPGIGSSYQWNAKLGVGNGNIQPFNQSKVKLPSQCFMLADALPLYQNFGVATEKSGSWHHDKDHKTYTVVFVDSHVRPVTEQDFVHPPELKGTVAAQDMMWSWYYITGKEGD